MLIVHRCHTCNHPDVWGERQPHPVLGLTSDLPTNCTQPACCRKCDWNPQPVTMPRWDRTGRPVTEVLPPGSQAPWFTSRSTHDCPACQALHAQLTGTTAPEGTAP